MHDSMQTDRRHDRTDALTGLASESALQHALAAALAEAQAHATPLRVLTCSIEHFEAFNDRWGHASGDQVMRLVAKWIKSSIKQQDTAARFGEQEFAIILPSTSEADAANVADQIARTVQSRKLVRRHTGECLGSVTLSFGSSEFSPGDTTATLLARAQQKPGDSALNSGTHLVS
jgi:diguanylate cyclase